MALLPNSRTLWRNVRNKFPEECETKRFFGDETTLNYATNIVQNEQLSDTFDAYLRVGQKVECETNIWRNYENRIFRKHIFS